MPADIKNIVEVQISRANRAVTQAGFGVLLILGTATFPDRIRTYQNLTEVAVDFLTNSSEYLAAQAIFSQEKKPERIKIAKRAAATVTDDLNLIQEEDKDWYALILVSRISTEVSLAAAWIQTQRKIFITCSNNANILDTNPTNDIASVFNTNNYTRSAVLYHSDPSTFPDAAWLGRCLPENPGSITWKFKTLAGIIADDLTPTERQNALATNANLYTSIGGRDITEEGTVATGEYIDVIRGIDWLQAQLEEQVYNILVNADKIPYTDAGVAIIESNVRAVLRAAQVQGVLSRDPDFEVTVPRVADINLNDKQNRFLPDVKFVATLASAIHKVQINGVVTL